MHRQVGRLLAFENATGIDAGEAARFDAICAIADETAGLGIAAVFIDRRDSMPQREFREPITPAEKERIGLHDEPTDPLLRQRREHRFDIAVAPGLEHRDRPSARSCRRPHVRGPLRRIGITAVEQQTETVGARQEFSQ